MKREAFYQMYAYLTRYENSTSAVLLYPYNSDISAESGEVMESWVLENQINNRLMLYSIGSRNENDIIGVLKKIIYENI